jgi:hypothetical protein
VSQQIDDGGPAFPCEALASHRDTEATKFGGMSLRDWLAGQALAGLMVEYTYRPHTLVQCAELACSAADAVIAQLKRPD